MILCAKNLHNISEVYVRYGLHQEMKAYRDGLEIYQVQKSHTKCIVLQASQNNLGFSLYVIPSVYHMVTASEDRMEFKESKY